MRADMDLSLDIVERKTQDLPLLPQLLSDFRKDLLGALQLTVWRWRCRGSIGGEKLGSRIVLVIAGQR